MVVLSFACTVRFDSVLTKNKMHGTLICIFLVKEARDLNGDQMLILKSLMEVCNFSLVGENFDTHICICHRLTQKLDVFNHHKTEVSFFYHQNSALTCGRHEHELVGDAVRGGVLCGPKVGQPAARLGPAGGHRPPLAARHEPGARARIVLR